MTNLALEMGYTEDDFVELREFGARWHQNKLAQVDSVKRIDISDREAFENGNPFFVEAGTHPALDGQLTQPQRDLTNWCETPGRVLQPRHGARKLPRNQRPEWVAEKLGCTSEQAQALIEAANQLGQPELVEQAIRGLIRTGEVIQSAEALASELADVTPNDESLDYIAGFCRLDKPAPASFSEEFVTHSLYDQGDYRPFLTQREVERLERKLEAAQNRSELSDLAVWLVENKALLWEDASRIWPLYQLAKERFFSADVREVCDAIRALPELPSKAQKVAVRRHFFKVLKATKTLVERGHMLKLAGKVGLLSGMPNVKRLKRDIELARTPKRLAQVAAKISEVKRDLWSAALDELRAAYQAQMNIFKMGVAL